MFAIEHYERADSLEEAIGLLTDDPGARLIAGGTDVLIRLREGRRGYGRLVDINELPELKGISMDDDGTVRIGALATFSQIMGSEAINRHVPVLAEAVGTAGGPQLRNVATVGGNICNGAVSADSVGALLVHAAKLEIQGPGGRRRTPLSGFHRGPGQVALARDEVLVAVHIHRPDYQKFGAAYFKYAMREAMDIATIGCAAAVRLKDDVIDELRLAFTVAAPTPVRCPHAERIAAGRPLTDAAFGAVAEAVEKDVQPRTSWRAQREFRLHIIRTLTDRMVRRAAERAGGKC
jgi:xanthine dehydrogenase FAD-binding subunit